MERLDLYYAHIDDRDTPQEETVDTLAELAEEGVVGLLGASNHATWRIDRGRAIARADGHPATSASSRSTATCWRCPTAARST